MRNANNENTSKGNFKIYGTVCAVFLCHFFQKRAQKNGDAKRIPGYVHLIIKPILFIKQFNATNKFAILLNAKDISTLSTKSNIHRVTGNERSSLRSY